MAASGFVYWESVETISQSRMEETPRLAQSQTFATPAATRTGYLLSQYPAVSHTFLLHEILGLRARGMHIETASINPPDRPSLDLPVAEAAEARRTVYIKDARRGRALSRLAGVLLRRPDVVLRGLLAILKMQGLRPRERAFWLFYLAEALLVGRWLKRRRLQHLHVHFGGAVATVGMLTSIAWRVPYSLTIHGPEELLDTSAYKLKEKLTQAAFVLCISDFCRSQLCALMPPDAWTKFRVVRLGVDPLVLNPRPRTPGERSEILRLVCTGRMVPAKGQRTLLEAISLLRDRGTNLQVVFIGAGVDLQSLQAYAARERLNECITFTGALSHAQTLAHLRRADLFALASFAEGIPVALMEAMSLAIPCVSTSVSGIPELIRSGVDGLLVPPANAAALANALELLSVDPVLRRSLGASARQRIIHQYNLPLNQELLAHTFRLRAGQADGSIEAGTKR